MRVHYWEKVTPTKLKLSTKTHPDKNLTKSAQNEHSCSNVKSLVMNKEAAQVKSLWRCLWPVTCAVLASVQVHTWCLWVVSWLITIAMLIESGITGETGHWAYPWGAVILILVRLVEVGRSTHSLGWDHRVYKEETVSFLPDFTSPNYDCGRHVTIYLKLLWLWLLCHSRLYPEKCKWKPTPFPLSCCCQDVLSQWPEEKLRCQCCPKS